MFKSDKNNVVYSNDILNKIRVQMETENILILKDLESVYPSLYELFNQNYIYLNGKKFVHLGESKSLSLVNNKFKVIIDRDEEYNKWHTFGDPDYGYGCPADIDYIKQIKKKIFASPILKSRNFFAIFINFFNE